MSWIEAVEYKLLGRALDVMHMLMLVSTIESTNAWLQCDMPQTVEWYIYVQVNYLQMGPTCLYYNQDLIIIFK